MTVRRHWTHNLPARWVAAGDPELPEHVRQGLTEMESRERTERGEKRHRSRFHGHGEAICDCRPVRGQWT